jgi:hypothetical protein
VVAVLSAFALLAGLAAAYQVGVRARQDPSFAVGGEFADPDDFPVPGVEGRGYPYGNVLDSATVPAAPAGTVATSSPVADTTATTASASATTTTPVTTVEPDLSTPRLPAPGTYSYALEGTEGATGFGSRSFPAQGTVVVHGDPSVRADELVHDVRLSGQHEERQIVRYTPEGIAFSFEGGSITFGPGTQTSQGHYDPLMVQIPFPLAAGATASASSAARTGRGATSRVETWTSKVVGQEQIDVLGRTRLTWVIDLQRTTAPGAAEEVDRFRRYWYDPDLGVWVQWTERFHGARDLLVDFTYDADYTARLVSFEAA